jgi:hypothetical protein
MQVFGTESHDFISDMCDELTVRLVNGKSAGAFHGRNAKLRHGENLQAMPLKSNCGVSASRPRRGIDGHAAREQVPANGVNRFADGYRENHNKL